MQTLGLVGNAVDHHDQRGRSRGSFEVSTPRCEQLAVTGDDHCLRPVRRHVDGDRPRVDVTLRISGLFRDMFEQQILLFDSAVRLVAERTMPEVLREIEELLRSTTSRDCVLVYYSGHGRLDQGNDFYLCTRDTNAGFLRSTAVNAGTADQILLIYTVSSRGTRAHRDAALAAINSLQRR